MSLLVAGVTQSKLADLNGVLWRELATRRAREQISSSTPGLAVSTLDSGKRSRACKRSLRLARSMRGGTRLRPIPT